MTREALPAGYAITYLPSRAILWTPDCREIPLDIDDGYQIMIASIYGHEDAIVAMCQRIERSH